MDIPDLRDKGGLSSGRQALVEGVKNNICGKVTRELVPRTLEVYPIANYGAVEIGVHRFYHPDTRMPSLSARRSSFTSGKTKMEYGRSLVSSASITIPRAGIGRRCVGFALQKDADPDIPILKQAIGVCEGCNSQFKSNKRSEDEVGAEIRAAFESHKCELTDDSQNARRFVHDSTEDE